MKKIILFLLLLISCCSEEPSSWIEIHYKGDHFLSLHNTDTEGTGRAYIAEKVGAYSWTFDYLENIIGKFNILRISVYKTTGEDYKDEGNLIFRMFENDTLIFEKILPYGETEFHDLYSFNSL
jgi:hypothetical protein